jgi:hypothetical protein
VTVTGTSEATGVADPHEVGWPLRPLLDASGLTARRLAGELGLSGSTVRIAARRGLSDRQADEWAIRLGMHPVFVWGWAWIEEAENAPRSAAAGLADRLRERIARGELRPGQPLPGVHALARQCGVGSKTAAQALAELRAEGIVVGGTAGPTPTTVASTVPTGPASCLACGRAIEAGSEHYPHRSSCTFARRGWCDCDTAAHPECCPACAEGPA